MNPTNPFTEKAETIRQETTGLLRVLVEKGAELSLPRPAPNLAADLHKLEGNAFQVLVAGEAKRGKSTFVNALIGRPILPTDVEIATCQVFRIRQASREAYRVCFENDVCQEIAGSELSRFGSQVYAGQGENRDPGEIIRWIEIDVPVRFLPKGVNLLDTPGLGSLYAAHSQITQRFVPLADAVIFVLDSEQPLIQVELDFIEKILAATTHLFFIQTKIDLHRREHWQAVQQRNQEILAERFGDRLADRCVWPISSTNLAKAAVTGDEDYLMVSRHRELAGALQAFLFRVSGWNRTAQAILAAGYYHGQSRQVLQSRLGALEEDSHKRRAEMQQLAARRKQQFESEWGPRGKKQQELAANIQKVTAVGKQGFREAIQPGGEIETLQRRKVEAAGSLEALRQVGDSLAEETIAASVERWQQVCGQAQAQLVELLAPFIAESQEISISEWVHGPSTQSISPVSLQLESDWWTRVKGVRGELFQATGTLQIATSLLGIAAPYLALAVVAVWGLYRGLKASEQTQLKAAQQELHKHLSTVLQEVRQYYLTVDLASGRLCLVDETFTALSKALLEQVQAFAAQKSAEAQAEVERLFSQSKLDENQRRVQAAAIRQALKDWDALGERIAAAAAGLKQLEVTGSLRIS
jgi:GTPase SAR1 family protein